MKKALGYIRFSTDDQKDGNSIERQTDHITAYCSGKLNLVETLIDNGFSASKGEHLSHGKLGAFLKDADQGKFQGYALVVEHMDRLSRLGIEQTNDLLQRILKAGIEVHITQENRVIGNLNDLLTVIMNSVTAFGAAEYSKKLSERIVKAWKSKRANIDSKPLTSLLPKWLKIENGKIVEVPEKVETVREIFRHAANGLGAKKIRQSLNGHGEGVTISWISHTLQNRATLGEYQPHHYVGGKRVPLGEAVFDYYPRILSDEEWTLARTDIERKSANRRMVHGARNSDRAENLFTGLVFDTTEDQPVRPMWFQRPKSKKGKLQSSFFVTSNAIEAPCHSLRYDQFETAFLNFLTELDWKAVSGEGEPEDLKQKVANLSRITDELATAKARCAAREELTADATGDTLMILLEQLTKFRAEAADLEVAREAAANEVESIRTKLATMDSPEKLLALISDTANNDVRLRLRSEIRRRISRIELSFGLDGFKCVADVKFINGSLRALILGEKKTLVIRAEGTI